MRARSLHGAALTVARDIGLHKIDSPDRRPVQGKDGVVMTEIKRRLWWHVASTDWLLSISGGPQEGCYLVHTRHMHVNRPRNITDDDLEKEGAEFNRPISEPTQMSYFLQRIRSAELARDIADAWPLGTSDVESVDYNQIIEVDAKFEEFFKDMPVFFRGDPECPAKLPYFEEMARHGRAEDAHQPVHPHASLQASSAVLGAWIVGRAVQILTGSVPTVGQGGDRGQTPPRQGRRHFRKAAGAAQLVRCASPFCCNHR